MSVKLANKTRSVFAPNQSKHALKLAPSPICKQTRYGEHRRRSMAATATATATATARRFRDSSNSSDPAAATTSPPLPPPLPDLGVALSAADLRATAYELLVAASRASGARPLTYIPQPATAAGKLKGTFGPESLPPSKVGRPAVLQLVRVRMGVTEQADARIRRVLLRVAARQVRNPSFLKGTIQLNFFIRDDLFFKKKILGVVALSAGSG